MNDPPASPRQLTLRRMLTSLLMVAVGLAILIRLMREIAMPGSVVLPVVLYPAWFGGGALIGAGLFHLKSSWLTGALASIPIQIVMLFVLSALFPNY